MSNQPKAMKQPKMSPDTPPSCGSPQTPLSSPVIPPSDPVTVLHLAELLKDVLKATKTTSGTTDTPKATAMLQLIERGVTAVELLATAKALPDSASPPEATEATVTEQPEPGEAKSRTSKVAYKKVDEVWDPKAYKYMIAEPVDSKQEANELNRFVFVVRVRIDKTTKDPTSYIDVKSEILRDVLRTTLQDVRGISLAEDMPSVEQNLLYHFLPDLELYQSHMRGDSKDTLRLKHLDLLIEYMKTTYKSTSERLLSLLKRKEITYDLLWTLFKPGSEVYSTCEGTRVARCVICDHGEEKVESNGSKYFLVETHYLDFDGKVLGEATAKYKVPQFRGAIRIDLLRAYPFQFHPNSEETRKDLIECGRTFVSLIGIHHRQYEGYAFQLNDKGEVNSRHVKSRIMVDAVGFQECNSNYIRPRIHQNKPTSIDLSTFELVPSDEDGQVKCADIDPKRLKEHDLLVCSPTVLGFSLDDKEFLEFAVKHISDIKWNPSFDKLIIPHEKKRIVRALSELYLNRGSDYTFDDLVQGKGKGVVLLLHGPPGVGKTLTAEAMAESLKAPLYVIAAGQLGVKAVEVERILSTTFMIATRWKATLLLDEADVFVAQRTLENPDRNALVSVFLRKLEYYEGILFITTNRVQIFDEAIASRVHLAIRYKPLDKGARKDVWRMFLAKAKTKHGEADCDSNVLEHVAGKNLNGREIKNAVSMAQALACYDKTRVSKSHLEIAITANEEFQYDFRGAGPIENMRSYT